MGGFFDGVDIMTEAMASTSTAVQWVPAKTSIPSVKLDPIEESA